MSKRKNISKSIPIGRTLQTRDEFLESGKDYMKPGYENKGLYRITVAIDSFGENIALVKLSSKGIKIEGSKKSHFKPFVETLDNEGNPIKPGKKFRPNSRKKDLTKRQVNQIKKSAFSTASKSLRERNRAKVRKMKGRI